MGAIGGVPRRLWGALFHSDNVPMTDANPSHVDKPSWVARTWARCRNHVLVHPRRVWALLCIASLGLLSFGLYLQHVEGLEPCPMCIMQRYVWVVIALIAGGIWYWRRPHEAEPQYRVATIARGALTQVVTATGQLNPVVNVQVGSQISGLIQKLYVDFNSKVKAGDLVNQVASQVGGKGGGRADMAQAGGTQPENLPVALQSLQGWLELSRRREPAQAPVRGSRPARPRKAELRFTRGVGAPVAPTHRRA